ncbi:TPA: restriction endonuclease subunit S [Serratia liquefaciens]|jgi:type I restriction enzyme S subunit
MSVDSKMPEIRFEGFGGDWEEKEFLDIATRVSTHHQSTYLPCVEYEDIVAGKGRLNKDIYQKKTFKTGLRFEADDVLFGKLRPYLKNWFLADFEGLAVGDFWVLRANNVASTFLFSLIQTNEFELIANLSAGSKMPRSDWGLVSSSCFFVPKNISESNEIGNYFQKLDALINQHQQKHDKLNSIKKAMLEKMFPKQGETIPEIRFKGFSGEWAEIKFSEMFNEKDGIRRGPFGGSIKKEMFVAKSDYVVYEQRNAIYDRYDTRYNISREKYQELINFSLASGDFIMSGAGTIGRVSRVPDGVKLGVFNQAIIRMKINDERINSEFFLQWIRSEKMQERLTESNPASAMVNLVPMNELKAWDVVVPNKKEQSTIGNYFQKLDALINQHQQQITKLNNIKQACLSKMFV